MCEHNWRKQYLLTRNRKSRKSKSAMAALRALSWGAYIHWALNDRNGGISRTNLYSTNSKSRRLGGLMVSALDSWASDPCSSPGRGHCVVFLGKTVNSHSASLHGVPAICWGNLTKLQGVTCDGLASRPGKVEIFLAASCYRNRDKLRQLWARLGSKASLNSKRFKYFQPNSICLSTANTVYIPSGVDGTSWP